MIAKIDYQGRIYTINLSKPLDISLPLRASTENVTAWYCTPPRFEVVITDHFTGDVNLGGAVNFRDIYFNPHGHGTHTECVGHISTEPYQLRACLKDFNMLATLISVVPEQLSNGDRVVTKEQLVFLLESLDPSALALIIRTIPNEKNKLNFQYSNTNPPYIEGDAMHFIVNKGIKHLLIDTPSVDREEDEGVLESHHIFWNYPNNTRIDATITELVYVPNVIKDGLYWMQLGVAAFENDASPSRPLLFAIEL